MAETTSRGTCRAGEWGLALARAGRAWLLEEHGELPPPPLKGKKERPRATPAAAAACRSAPGCGRSMRQTGPARLFWWPARWRREGQAAGCGVRMGRENKRGARGKKTNGATQDRKQMGRHRIENKRGDTG
eukprot:scaffold1311_cov121-Isochrysis_galbana.AAC.6